MTKLTPDEFEDAVGKGLGRAMIHVRVHGDAGVEESIEDAFKYDLRTDPQCEENRAEWLLEMAEAAGNSNRYRLVAYKALDECRYPDSWHLEQLRALAQHAAASGDARGRQALESEFERTGANWQNLVELDGEAGLRRVLREADRLELYGWGWPPRCAESMGEETAWRVLREEAAQSAAAQKVYRDACEHRDREPRKAPAVESTDEVRKEIETGGDNRLTMWVRVAPATDVLTVFEWLVEERRPEQLRRLIWMFRNHKPPRLENRLFELARHEDEKIWPHARRSLSHWRDASVRALGLDLLEEEGSPVKAETLELFRENLEPGDARESCRYWRLPATTIWTTGSPTRSCKSPRPSSRMSGLPPYVGRTKRDPVQIIETGSYAS